MSQQVEDLIKFAMVLATCYGGIWKAADYLKSRDKENSLGAEKVKQLENDDDELRKSINALEEDGKRSSDQINELKTNYSNLINHVWDIFKK